MNEFANIDKYPFTIRPLSSEDGGGFLIEYPDLPGCHSDGDTPC
jgi:antitoxin HicB